MNLKTKHLKFQLGSILLILSCFFLIERPTADETEKKQLKTQEPKNLEGAKNGALTALHVENYDEAKYFQKLANAYINSGDSGKAIDTYLRALKEYPADKRIQKDLLSFAAASGKASDYKEICIMIQKNDPQADYAQFELAKIFLTENDKNRSYQYLRKALRNHPEKPIYRNMLAEVLTTPEQILENFETLKDMSDRSDADPRILMLAATGYSLNKETRTAAQMFKNLYSTGNVKLLENKKFPIFDLFNEKHYKIAGDLADKFLKNADKNNRTIRVIQIKSYVNSGKNGKSLREAINELVLLKPVSNEWWYLLARLDLEEKDSSAAIRHCWKWLESNSDDVDAYLFLRSLVENKPGHKDKYVIALERLIGLEPEKAADRHLDLGTYFYNEKQFSDAVKHLQIAGEKYPRNAEIWFKLGNISNTLNNKRSGAELLKKAWDLEPNNVAYARARGAAIENRDDLKSNIKVFKFLKANHPHLSERRKLAMAYFLNSQFIQSSNEWADIIQTYPELQKSERIIAQSFLKSGRSKEAAELFEYWHGENPADLNTLENLIELYSRLNKPKEYLLTLERIVALDPNYKDYELKLADEYRKTEQDSAAVRHYTRWIIRNPRDIDALISLHGLVCNFNDTLRIIETLRLLVRDENIHRRYRFQLAELNYLQFKETAEIEELVEKYPEYREGKIILINDFFSSQKISKLVTFEKFMAGEVKNIPAFWGPLAEVYSLSGKTSLANRAFLNYLKLNEKNKNVYDRCYEYAKETNSPYIKEVLEIGYFSFPEDIKIKMAYAIISGSTDKSLKIYEEILKIEAEHIPAVIGGALTALELKKKKKAEQLLLLWVRLQPDAKALNLLVDIYLETGENRKLANTYGQLSELNPENEQLAFKAALEYKNLNKNKEALQYIIRAYKVNPEEINIKKLYGLMREINGNHADAKPVLLEVEKQGKFDEQVGFALYRIFKRENNQPEFLPRLEQLVNRFPDNKEYVYDMAEIEYLKKNQNRVIKLLEQSVINKDINARMAFILAVAYLETGQEDKLEVLVKKITREFPSEIPTSFEMAIIFYHRKSQNSAKNILLRINRKKPTEGSFYYAGRIAFDEENWNEAIENFLKSKNYAFDIQLFLGQAYIKAGNKNKAVIHLENYSQTSGEAEVLRLMYPLYRDINDIPGAIRTLERLAKADPDNIDGQIELAELYNAVGQENKSQDIFRLILKKKPDHPKANLTLGKIRALSQDHKSALNMLNAGLKAYPEDWKAWEMLGTCYLKLKQNKQALEAYSTSFKINDTNLTVAIGKLEAVKLLKLEEALPEAYRDVIRLDSNNGEAAFSMGHIYYEKGDLKNAVKMYQLAVKRIKDDRIIWKNYGMALIKTHQLKGAEDALKNSVDLGETDPEVLVRLGEIQVNKNELKPAEKNLINALKQDSANHFALFLMGKVARMTNKLEDSESYFARALAKNPASTAYYESLADVFKARDKADDCITTLLKVSSSLSNDGKLLLAGCYEFKGMFPEALTYANLVYSASPSEDVMHMITNLYLKENEPEKAIEIIHKSEFGQSERSKLAFARAHSKAGRFSSAHKIASSLQNTDADNPDYFRLQGEIYYDEKEFKKSLKKLSQALKIRADMPEAQYLKGLTFLKMGKDRQAGTAFKTLIKSDNPYWKARGYLGLAKLKKYDTDYIGMINELRASYESKFNTESVYHLVQTLVYLNKVSEAKEILKKAEAINNTHPRMIAASAEILLAENKKEIAFQILKRKLESSPNSCEILITLTKTNWQMGNYDNVRTLSNQILNVCSEEPEAYLYLGSVNYRVFDKKKAKENFKIYLKNGGDKARLPKGF